MYQIREAALGAYWRGADVLPNDALESDAFGAALRADARAPQRARYAA